MSRWRSAAGALLAVTMSGGCTLIDQRTFDAQAGLRPVTPVPPAPPVPAPAAPGAPPLLTIRLPADDLRAVVGRAVDAARARRPGVAFDVVEITPDGGAGAGTQAEEVGQAIIARGIPAARVRLAARPVADALREVRVYVR